MPCAIVFRVDVDRVAVRVDRRGGVLELDVLVPHKGPGREEMAIELEGAAEVEDRLLVLRLKGVIVTDDAACLRAEFVD